MERTFYVLIILTLSVCRTHAKAYDLDSAIAELDRAIKKLTTAGGYYWQYPEDVPTFAERLKQKQQTAARVEEVPVSAPADYEPAPVVKIAHDLTNFSDQELFVELERRGYQGELQVIKKVTIGIN